MCCQCRCWPESGTGHPGARAIDFWEIKPTSLHSPGGEYETASGFKRAAGTPAANHRLCGVTWPRFVVEEVKRSDSDLVRRLYQDGATAGLK
jgi:hypothetical protein